MRVKKNKLIGYRRRIVYNVIKILFDRTNIQKKNNVGIFIHNRIFGTKITTYLVVIA